MWKQTHFNSELPYKTSHWLDVEFYPLSVPSTIPWDSQAPFSWLESRSPKNSAETRPIGMIQSLTHSDLSGKGGDTTYSFWRNWRSENATSQTAWKNRRESFIPSPTQATLVMASAPTSLWFMTIQIKCIVRSLWVRLVWPRGKALKPVTIPRLEMTAALVSIKVSLSLQWEFEYQRITEVFWTGSQIVSGYISNAVRRVYVFVAKQRATNSGPQLSWSVEVCEDQR